MKNAGGGISHAPKVLIPGGKDAASGTVRWDENVIVGEVRGKEGFCFERGDFMQLSLLEASHRGSGRLNRITNNNAFVIVA